LVFTFIKNIRNKLKRLGVKKGDARSESPQKAAPSPVNKFSELEPGDSLEAGGAAEVPSQRKGRRRRRRKKRPSSLEHAAIQETAPAATLPWNEEEFSIPLADGKLRFHDLDLPSEIMHAIYEMGFQYCTPIQAEILPSTLAGEDATGRAQTGTGKTAAFLIAIFTRFLRTPLDPDSRMRQGTPRALILAPTRELVMQIVDEAHRLSAYSHFFTIGVFGGIDYDKQQRDLKGKQIDVLVATPGRLLDFHRRKVVHLNRVEILVIDEADRMLDMGFIPDVKTIVYSTPTKSNRQTLLFSATLTEDVSRLARQWTRDPVKVEIEPEKVAVDSVQQIVYIVTTEEKMGLLYNIIARQNLERVIVFCNRRDETRHLTELLREYQVSCTMISGEIQQKSRIRALEDFKSGKIRVLVATDVAGRGLHIEGVSHVINYTLPHDPEDYVHRIGRTGRAGATGTSISFACEEDSFFIPDIETLLGHSLPCTHPEEEWLTLPQMPGKKETGEKQKPKRRRRPHRHARSKRTGADGRPPKTTTSSQ
jgi:ATP-dependent RNA helicase RhlB